MIDKVKKFKEFSGEFSKEMDNVLMKVVALEETCSSQQDQLKNLNYQLATANEKLKELKGNIRVFCGVRPTLPEIDGRGADGTIVSYPTNVENLGRGIELMQNAQKISFTFDKVFGHEASQEDVFVEISQLVQSTLDGYKPCLGGDSKTLMFVNISPEASSASESICSLQFAARVNA